MEATHPELGVVEVFGDLAAVDRDEHIPRLDPAPPCRPVRIHLGHRHAHTVEPVEDLSPAAHRETVYTEFKMCACTWDDHDYDSD